MQNDATTSTAVKPKSEARLKAEREEKNLNRALLGMILVIFCLWLFNGWIMRHATGLPLPDTLGSFGDMFGSLNALFSGLAFGLLIYTAWMQRIELRLQRDELELTREEFTKQTTIHDEHLQLLKTENDRRQRLQEIEQKPRFMIRFRSIEGSHYFFELTNGGAPVYDLEIWPFQTSGLLGCRIEPDTILNKNEKSVINCQSNQLAPRTGKAFKFRLTYKDIFNEKQELYIGCIAQPGGFILTVVEKS